MIIITLAALTLYVALPSIIGSLVWGFHDERTADLGTYALIPQVVFLLYLFNLNPA